MGPGAGGAARQLQGADGSPPSTPRRRRCANISAKWHGISTLFSIAARAASRSSRPTNGSCRATGSFRPRISAATPITCLGAICRRSRPAFSHRGDGQPAISGKHGVAGQRPCPRFASAPTITATRRCRRSRNMSARSAPRSNKRLGPRAELINPIVGTVFPNFSMLRGTSRTLPRLAAARPGQDRDLVLGVCRQGGARRRSRSVPARRRARVQPVRHVRAGRHGQLAGMHPAPAAASCRGGCRSTTRWGSGTSASMRRSAPGPAITRFSESNHRQFYNRWAELMAAEQLGPAARGPATHA